jgi:hypothetical protein
MTCCAQLGAGFFASLGLAPPRRTAPAKIVTVHRKLGEVDGIARPPFVRGYFILERAKITLPTTLRNRVRVKKQK